MDPEILDLSFYLGTNSSEQSKNLDVPLSNGQIVSINLDEELPDDSLELVSFLETENCPTKYWISVAQAYCWKSKPEEALKMINHALKGEALPDTTEDKIKLHSFLSWLYLKNVSLGVDSRAVNLKRAAEEISIVSRGDASNVPNLLAKAILYLYRDEHVEKSIEIFDRLLKIDATNCFALLGKAQIILKKTKNYSNALKLYQQVLLINPVMKPDPRIGIGLCFWLLKDEKMAVLSWQRSLELDPDNVKARVLLCLSKFNLIFNESLTDDDFIANYKTSLNELANLHKQAPNDNIILLSLASYYFAKQDYDTVNKIGYKVVETLGGGKGGESISSGKQSSYNSILLSNATLWLGRVSFAQSDYTKSQKYFHESIKLNDLNLLSKLGLGQSQISRGLIEEAIITYESILKTDLKCLEVNYSLGCLYSIQKGRRKQELAIQMLEKYLRLCAKAPGTEDTASGAGVGSEPVILNALLTLAKLYESKDLNQSLNYLNKAIESRKLIGKDVPLEVYNNVGVIHFIKNNFDSSSQFFQTSLNNLDESDKDLANELKLTINFNLARSKEISNKLEAIEIYEKLLEECPSYFSAKLRLLFLNCITDKKDESTLNGIKEEIESLLSSYTSSLEVRSFYGWFLNTFGKRLQIKPDADTTHQKDTLVEYDSHDCYALLSLANIYCIMAREIKVTSAQQGEKRKKYYIRAIELFSKVLSVDPKDVYAAQGLAIIYIESKETHKGLDILRKIRDSLNDVSIYLNLAHVLLDMKQFIKSIENYEIALHRFGGNNDSKIISLLGRAWYLRGMYEKNIVYLKKSLEFSEEALNEDKGTNGANKSNLKFNLAYVQFQIAEYVSKLPVDQRNVEDIKSSILGLNEAISVLNDLASEEEKYAPYPKADLKARANLGQQTLLNRLNVCLEETTEFLAKFEHRLEEAQKEREREEQALLREEEERRSKQREIEEDLAKERAKLQEQAQQWVEENRMNVIEDNDNDDGFEDDQREGEEKAKRAKGRKAAAGSTKKGKKEAGKKSNKRKKKNAIEDSDEESVTEKSEPEASESEPEQSDNEGEEPTAVAQDKPSKKRSRNGKKNRIADDDEDEDGEEENSGAKSSGNKRRKSFLSSEKIVDSDEDLDDDGLFEENGEEE